MVGRRGQTGANGSEEIRFRRRGKPVIYENRTWFYPMAPPVRLPVGMVHLDSAFCWCDPLVEVDDEGNEVVLHRQVVWH